jgi:hypothetical protein
MVSSGNHELQLLVRLPLHSVLVQCVCKEHCYHCCCISVLLTKEYTESNSNTCLPVTLSSRLMILGTVLPTVVGHL